MRQILLIALVATIGFGSVQMATARGAPAPVGTMVLCIGHGTAVVLVDAKGQPTRAAHLCPDCVAAWLHPDLAPDRVMEPAAAPMVHAPSAARNPAPGAVIAWLARGPPTSS